MTFLPAVVNRADRTGLMIAPVVLLLIFAQDELPDPVHEASVVKFKVYPLTSCAGVIGVLSRVNVGMMCNPVSDTYELAGSSVVQSKEPVLWEM